MRIHGGDGQPGELGEGLRLRLLRHRRLEPARAEPERQQLPHLGAALPHEVDAGDAAIDDTVLHVLRHVRCAHEQNLDRRVAAGKGERTVAGLLGAEPCVLEQVERGIAQPALGRHRNPQEAERSSAVR